MEDDQAKEPRPGEAFHFFRRLPVELRLKIWRLNLPDARIVEIRCGAVTLSDRRRPRTIASNNRLPVSSSTPTRPPPTGCCTSPSPLPANLHACSESRAEALRVYEFRFGIAGRPGRVAFDFQRDVLFFGPRPRADGFMAAEAQLRTVLALASSADRASVRRAAISEALLCGRVTAVAAVRTADVLRLVHARLSGLKELVFVPWHGNRNNGRGDAIDHTRRLRVQIAAAIDAIKRQDPDWEPPPWRIASLDDLAGDTLSNAAKGCEVTEVEQVKPVSEILRQARSCAEVVLMEFVLLEEKKAHQGTLKQAVFC